jgi:hypothetical protein
VCQTSTKAQIDIPLLFLIFVSKVDVADKGHESINNGDVIDIDASVQSAPLHKYVCMNSNSDRTGVFTKI